jgi:hypothetical protein
VVCSDGIPAVPEKSAWNSVPWNKNTVEGNSRSSIPKQSAEEKTTWNPEQK